MNIFKFIYCLFVGHEWGDRGGSYDVCWRCGHVIETEPRQTKDLQLRRTATKAPVRPSPRL